MCVWNTYFEKLSFVPRSSCGPADSELDSHTTGPRVQDPVGTVLSTELPTGYHHNSIGLSIRWCVWKVGEGFPGRVLPKTLKWVSVWRSTLMDSTATGRPHVYTVTGWGVMPCLCRMAFLCGSTLVKVPLLQVGTIMIWPQMFKSDVKHK